MKSQFVLFVSLLLALPCFAHQVVEADGNYVITHQWTFQDRQWSCDLNIPVELYRYYQGRAHRSDQMVEFVLSDYDRQMVRSLAQSFNDIHNVISFVQSLRYVSDLESKGEDDYIRFPVETLVDGVGDCEDMAILAAAVLYEMGYPVLLVQLPDHLALAVDCGSELQGTYYTYQDSRYYYLEVTNTGWDIGQIPDAYKNSPAQLIPLLHRPRIRLPQCKYQQESYFSTDSEVLYELTCDLENPGPGSTEGLSIRLLFARHNGIKVVERVFRLDEMGESDSIECKLNVLVPRPFYGKLEIHVEGDNFNTESLVFNDIELP